mgnify:CR=1 FL=1
MNDNDAIRMTGLPLTIVIVSYNTRALTLRCLETLRAQTRTPCRVVVFDNASTDGSAEAVAATFPDIELIRSTENLGFARANNVVTETVDTPWLLLLNPDTEILDHAVDRLLAFATANPAHGIYGGRTVFADGSLNIASCWNRITPWSAFCRAVGLTALFPRTTWFDTEAIGAWQRDTIQEVDIIVGCFLLIRTELWQALGGFDPLFWMYGEEADLCLRARRLGARPVVIPDATIVHHVGAASASRADKIVQVARARVTLIQRHWPPALRWWGTGMAWLWGALRVTAASVLGLLPGETNAARLARWRTVWKARNTWMGGYV